METVWLTSKIEKVLVIENVVTVLAIFEETVSTDGNASAISS